MRISATGVACLLLGLALNACAPDPKPSAESSRPELPLAKVDEATAGTIRGVVRFAGSQPALPDIDFSSNPQCERQHRLAEKPETIVVNPNQTLRNVFVWIKSGLPPARWDPPAAPAKLDQAACIYKPHVLAIMVNQQLDVANSDTMNHDVHAESKMNEPFNFSEAPKSQTISHRFVHEEVWIPITCGVHPWMKSYLSVVSHPFFAVTGGDGAFELKGVPPGDYMVEAVQEQLGRKEMRVTLNAKQTQTTDFTYAE